LGAFGIDGDQIEGRPTTGWLESLVIKAKPRRFSLGIFLENTLRMRSDLFFIDCLFF
jgi:hypothetical protein